MVTPVKALIQNPLESSAPQKVSEKGFSTESCFFWLHAKNVEFKSNIRGLVNHEYNRLLQQKGLIAYLIPGGEDLNQLGMDRTTSIIRPDLYFHACQTTMSNFTNSPFSGLAISTDTFFDLLHEENVKHEANIRGQVNQSYNQLVHEGKIPGDSDLERLGMDRKTSLRADLYLKAYAEVIAHYEKPLIAQREEQNEIIPVDYKEKYFTEEQLAARKSLQTFAKIHLLEPHSLFFVVICAPDGWGDLGNALNAVRLIKEEYPEWSIRLLIQILRRPVGTPIPFNIEQDFGLKSEEYFAVYRDYNLYSLNEDALLPPLHENKGFAQYEYESELPEALLSKKVDEFRQFIRTADLHIGVSTDISFPDPDINKTGPKFIQFYEYEGRQGRPKGVNTMHMGVSPNCCGIHILDPIVPDYFIDPSLQQFFIKYPKFYFNYGKSIDGFISITNQFNKDAKELNFISNVTLYEFYEYKGRILSETGAKRILFIDKSGQEHVLGESEPEGKTIRLFNPFPLAQGDMKRAMLLSQGFLGSTGNSSFSEACSEVFGKLPFYNVPSNHPYGEYFWQGLIELAEQATPENQTLISYLRQVLHKQRPLLSQNKQNFVFKESDLPILHKEWRQLAEILRKDWNVKNAYIGAINHRLVSEATAPQYGLEQHLHDEALVALWKETFSGEGEIAPPVDNPEEMRSWLAQNTSQLHGITRICIRDLGIKVIPQEIVMFPMLNTLILEGNQISRIPDFVGLCPHLDCIRLLGNQISEIPDCFIPDPEYLAETRVYIRRKEIKTIPQTDEKL